MDDLFSSPASATAAAAAGSLQTDTAGNLGAVGGADNSSTHRVDVPVHVALVESAAAAERALAGRREGRGEESGARHSGGCRLGLRVAPSPLPRPSAGPK